MANTRLQEMAAATTLVDSDRFYVEQGIAPGSERQVAFSTIMGAFGDALQSNEAFAASLAAALAAYFQSLPTTLPSSSGALWWNAGVLSKS